MGKRVDRRLLLVCALSSHTAHTTQLSLVGKRQRCDHVCAVCMAALSQDPAYTIMETQSAAVESSADMDVLPAFLGLECAMGLMSSLEQLAVRVRGNDAISALQQQNAADKGDKQRPPVGLSGAALTARGLQSQPARAAMPFLTRTAPSCAHCLDRT